jgi:fibro-slime domain-containing protein
MNRTLTVASILVALAACGKSNSNGDGGAGGGGDGGGGGGGGGDASGESGGDGSGSCGTILGTIRDFVGVETPGYAGSGTAPMVHPDFEHSPTNSGAVKGLVDTAIGSDRKPVLNGASPDLATAFLNYGTDGVTTNGSETGGPNVGAHTKAGWFAAWYTDTNGLSSTVTQDFPLTANPDGTYVYDSAAYFPLDNAGWGIESSGGTLEKGDDGNPHNFHFTTEFHASFKYMGGEKFTFRGDDDVWVFVNDKLAIDIGGIHGPVTEQVDFDADTETDGTLDTSTGVFTPTGNPTTLHLGLTVGSTYNIDFFNAERHVTGSNFRLQTSIACFNTVIF